MTLSAAHIALPVVVTPVAPIQNGEYPTVCSRPRMGYYCDNAPSGNLSNRPSQADRPELT